MANTYSQIFIQLIFVVKNREPYLLKQYHPEIYKYINGIIINKNQKLLAINGIEDHIHLLIGLKPDIKISDLVRAIKISTTKFINEQSWMKFNFQWQTGYAAFSYSKADVNNVYRYIMNQEEHHRKVTFKEEYIKFLKDFKIEYEEKYLFD